ncbi:hypothetical protein DPMN_096099 [Dreissena polymorpha]|uniref:Uncharacterized protein n=1 Tax=Dreissena polymorpha TaxID=45954 RepID=A0A9D4L8T1_DREPO|nr:hypothetical protein DPMN_096099 [Dreissena polymorpha]
MTDAGRSSSCDRRIPVNARGQTTWVDSTPNTYSFHFRIKMPTRKVAAQGMQPSQTEDQLDQLDDRQHDQEKEEPSQPQINPEQAEAVSRCCCHRTSTLFLNFLHNGFVYPSLRNQLMVIISFITINVLKVWIPRPHNVVEHQAALCDQDGSFRNNAQCTK